MLSKSTKFGKGFILLVALVLTFSLVLSACGGGKKEEASSSPSASSASPSESSASPSSSSGSGDTGAADLQPYELKIIWEGPAQKDAPAVEAKINEYLKDKINATVKLSTLDWGQYDQKMPMMIASREAMDVVFTAQWNGHSNNVAKGGFLALNDPNLEANGQKVGNLLEQYGKDILSSLDPAFLEGAKINGFNYGIPTNKELAAQGGVIYRVDIAQELGLTDQLNNVKTIADLEPILKTVKEKKPNITPLFFKDGETFNSHYLSQLDYLGNTDIDGIVRKDGEDTKVITRFDDKEYMDQLQLTRKFFQEGLINRDAATTTVGPQDAMKKGDVFMIPSSLKPGKDAEMANGINMAGKLKQIEIGPRTVSTGETAGAMLGISSTSKDPARAMMFINLLHSDKYLNNLINFGIEGEHYVKVSDNVIKAGPKAADYNPGVAWELGNQFLNYTFETEAADKWDQFKKFNDGAHKSPALGFTFDVEPVKSQVTNLINVKKQYAAALETGSIDPAKAQEWWDKEKANGLDKVLEEKQKQLDAFIASKK
ncbi:ABC transporter substrate-binding protein [Cohnella caldifontis]|uniref:ABC transporter substrate-binding protein n=1 Tax=Cohnella caldifontis TaxID=3027471 RepID=UPI0023EB1B01|nr:ABC transporter substrate-binding protein [Cohnella sp. YIM B05605]